MNNSPANDAVIRVSRQIHREAKSAAARAGIPLSTLAAEALEREITRREARELRRIAAAPMTPTQTR